jgi:hypothetical protein
MRRAITIGTILSVLLGLFPAIAVAQTSAAEQCFPGKTAFCIQGRFLDYWNAHGGLAINGYPLTGERQEKLEDGNTYTVQWFERVRMEYHPEHAGTPSEVLLGQFGRAIHPADPPVGAQPGMQYFDVTGHNVPGDFIAYWAANGGLPQFGYPLSEVFREKLDDGNTYEVQYFERARFERHPENGPPFNILLGQFGRRILAGLPAAPDPWGAVVPPLSSNYSTYNDPQGRFAVRVPQDWTNKEPTGTGIIFRKPGPLWGAEIALNDGSAFTDISQVDPIIEQQLHDWLTDYVPISKDQVIIGTHHAYRRVFQHKNAEGQTEIIVRIYFLSGPWLYQVNGFMLPGDRGTVEPLVNGLAGSIATNP